MAGTESRQHPRARTRVKVEFHFGSSTGVGYTNDVSEGGMFLACSETAAPGTRVYLRMHLPDGEVREPLKIIGLVTRVAAESATGPAGMGIHFEVAYARTREALADFIDALLSLAPGGSGPSIRVVGSADDGDAHYAASFPSARPGAGRSGRPRASRESLRPEELRDAFDFEPPEEPAGRTARTAVLIALFLALAVALAVAARQIGGMLGAVDPPRAGLCG